MQRAVEHRILADAARLLAILLVVLSVNLVGDAVRDLLDPRLRRL